MFSKPCQYALRAVIYLASNSRRNEALGARQIAGALNIPHQYLSKILQQISRQNLISSVKGPNGGFYLNEHNLKTPLLQIIECIDGPTTLNSCILGLLKCSGANPCPLHAEFSKCREGLKNSIGNKNLRDFIGEAQKIVPE